MSFRYFFFQVDIPQAPIIGWGSKPMQSPAGYSSVDAGFHDDPKMIGILYI
jgi:hypothetical protein